MDPLVSALESIASEMQQVRHQRTLNNLSKPSEFEIELKKSEPLIQKNFEEWRDYLHKYTLIMMAIAGFFATLFGSQWTRTIPDPVATYVGFGFIGLSILLALITIFTAIFVERQIVDARVFFALGTKKREDTENPIDAMRLNYLDAIGKNEKLLESATEPKDIAWLEQCLKADRRGIKRVKYIAAPATWYEYVRFWTTLCMIILSFVGVIMLMNQLLTKSLVTTASTIIFQPTAQYPSTI